MLPVGLVVGRLIDFGDALDAERAARLLVDLDQRAVQFHRAFRHGKNHRSPREEALDDRVDFTTEARLDRADEQLKEVASKRFAVIRFSGLAGEESLKRQTDLLTKFVSARKLTAVSAPTYAFYNPPWTLPFLRRNEVMIEVTR